MWIGKSDFDRAVHRRGRKPGPLRKKITVFITPDAIEKLGQNPGLKIRKIIEGLPL